MFIVLSAAESSEVCSRSAGEYVLSLAPFVRFLLPQAVATELLLFRRPRVLAALLYASRTGGLSHLFHLGASRHDISLKLNYLATALGNTLGFTKCTLATCVVKQN